jgi:membrane-bound ClpP family serine protease
MKPLQILGIALLVLGLVSLAYQGITYTKTEKLLEVGPITATKEKKETIPLPPVLGGAALAVGVVLLVAGARR